MYPSKGIEQSKRVAYFDAIQKLGAQVEDAKVKMWEEYAKAIHEDQLLTIIHTSGSSGIPKGAMLTHKNILSNVLVVQEWVIRMVPEDITLSYLPISHVFERMAGHYTPISIGATIGYAESIETILQNFQEIKPTIFTSVPRLFEKVHTEIKQNLKQSSTLKNKIFEWALAVGKEKYKCYVNKRETPLLMENKYGKKLTRKWKLANALVFKNIKGLLGGNVRAMISGGGTLNENVAEFFWSLDLPILEGYGLTETSPVVTTNPLSRARIGTVGKVLPNLEVKIAEDGEILVKGPSVMKGYYNDEIETKKAFNGDWFKTGDIGVFDEDDYLKITDRKKRMIILSTGMNVAPQQVESAINESPYISNSLVIGQDKKFISCIISPERTKLTQWAKRKNIEGETIAEIIQHPLTIQLFEREIKQLTKELSNYAQPKQIVLVADEWTVENELLTPKLSIRYNIIENKYKQIIEGIYDSELRYVN